MAHVGGVVFGVGDRMWSMCLGVQVIEPLELDVYWWYSRLFLSGLGLEEELDLVDALPVGTKLLYISNPPVGYLF